jgi:hypothetical protein
MCDRRNRAVRVFAAVGVICSCFAVTAAAQQPPDAAAKKWRVTFYGGFATGGTPTGGSGFIPPPGEAFIPVPFAPVSRRVATWWLGDGSAIINDVFRLTTPPGPPGPTPPPALRALDTVVTSASVERGAGGVFGVRATRLLTHRLDLEFDLEVGLQNLSLTDQTLDTLHSTRGTFTSTFDELLARQNRSNRSVTATLTTPQGTARRSAVTGAIIYNFRPGQDVEPYVIAGGGMMLSSGTVEYTLVGRYSFVIGNSLNTGETDTLRVVTDWSNSPMAVFGGGIRRATSARTGFSAEARLQLSSPSPRTHIEATPARDPATSGSFGALVFLTTPSLAIVGVNSMGFDSSLSAPAIANFTTFAGTGKLLSVNVTVGYFVRF